MDNVNYFISSHKVAFRKEVSQSAIDSFHSRLEINFLNGCWIWTGGHKGHWGNKMDYGIFGNMLGDRYQTAHKASWFIHYGEIPEGMDVCHKCDNPRCCNPDHLFLGTHTENMRDMISKGRHRFPRGENCHVAKLTENDVFAIKALVSQGANHGDIAKKFKVTRSTISKISRGDTWSWLR